ncbi:trehalose-phosphatase [uncultured Alsobacter sp.]|uniref:trehalose-phosphatase n=1 Tax=uncultured Alsobacter sp. TaxID=1748258 RepID=UPI0025FD1D4C|nr:trehalose-phosphatase [uncultured Alsobacter sp.]
MPMTSASCHASAAPALFLDFDGTLVDIAPAPDAVRVDPALPGVLHAIAERLGGALAIVTGRPVDVVDRYLAPHRFDVAGLHGAVIRVAGRDIAEPAITPSFRAEVARLADGARPLPGLIVEDKGASVAVHWRLAPEFRPAAEGLARTALAALGPEWRLQTGKAVLEIVRAGTGKGRAIARLLTEPPYEGRTAVFIGDDDTDEQGFAEVLARGGLAVRVGDGETRAPLRVSGPAALAILLRRWAETGQCPFPLPGAANDETMPFRSERPMGDMTDD